MGVGEVECGAWVEGQGGVLALLRTRLRRAQRGRGMGGGGGWLAGGGAGGVLHSLFCSSERGQRTIRRGDIPSLSRRGSVV